MIRRSEARKYVKYVFYNVFINFDLNEGEFFLV